MPEAGDAPKTEPAAPPAPEAALREPGFLARWPRNLKLAIVTLVVFFIALLFIFGGKQTSSLGEKIAARREAIVHSAERMTASKEARKANPRGDINATALNEQDDHSVKLTSAPDPGLTDDSSLGSLPRIGEDGRLPWQVYARPFNMADKRPRLGIVIVDLGLDRVASDAAISRLPTNVTLVFDSQSPAAGAWSNRARQDGHETLLAVPMEPFDYPRSDPGTNALLTTLPNSDNIQRLYAFMRQGNGYVGIMTMSGSRFTDSPEKMRPVLDAMKQRGLMIFDARVAPHSVIMDMAHDMHVPAVEQTTRIDQDLSPAAIDGALDQLEKDARLNGHAIGVTAAEPAVLEKLQAWLKDLPSHGIALAPVSAMVE